MAEALENQKLDEQEYYPIWLGQSVLNDDFQWSQSKLCSVQEFLEKYTLHDSIWVLIKHDVAYADEALIVIRWDSVWLPDEIAESSGVVQDWPILLIKLDGVDQISTLGYENIGGIQRGIASAEIESIDGKSIFTIYDHYGGSVDIVFDGTSRFLALNTKKQLLKI